MTFEGARIPEQPFATDDGSRAPEFAAALARVAAGEPVDLVEVLRSTRLLSPLVAVLDELDTSDSSAEPVEKESHLAAPYYPGADGRRASIAFTCVEAARNWDPAARVVPAAAPAAAAAALGDGATALVIDPADPAAQLLDLAALHRLAGQLAPVPDLGEVIERALAARGLAVTWAVVAGPEGVPTLLLELDDEDPVPTLRALAGELGSDPEVKRRSPLGIDFGVPG